MKIGKSEFFADNLPDRFIRKLVAPQPCYQILIVILIDVILNRAAGREGSLAVSVPEFGTQDVVHLGLRSYEAAEEFLLLLSQPSKGVTGKESCKACN